MNWKVPSHFLHIRNVMDGPGEGSGGIKRTRDIQHVEIRRTIGTKKQKCVGWIGHGGERIPLGKLLISSASPRRCIATGLVAYRDPARPNGMIDRSGK